MSWAASAAGLSRRPDADRDAAGSPGLATRVSGTFVPTSRDRRMAMRKSRLIAAMLLGGGLLALPALLPDADAGVPEAQTLAPGTARVWFLRPSDSVNRNVVGAETLVFAKGGPVGPIPAGTDFFRDVPAGAFRSTVQPFGLPTGDAAAV